jgi:hypothetical protein
MPVIALFDCCSGHAGCRDLARNGLVILVENTRVALRDDHPVALVEIGDLLGERGQRERV